MNSLAVFLSLVQQESVDPARIEDASYISKMLPLSSLDARLLDLSGHIAQGRLV